MNSSQALRRLVTPTLLALVVGAGAARADYPQKPVTVITPTGAGTGPDAIARIIFDRLGQTWSRPVMVVNRPGGGGVVGLQALVGAERDGYTLFLPVASTLVVLPETQAKLPLDVQRELVPIGLFAEQPMVIAAHVSLGVNTLPELIALAKSRPGQITYGAGRGTVPHMTAELLAERAGIELHFISYPSTAKALQDAMAGVVSLSIESVATLGPAADRGAMRLLAVASSSRLPNLPQVPTVAETVPGFEARGWFGLMALAGTPEKIVSQVNRDLRAVLEQPEVRQRLQAMGTYARPLTPRETADFIRGEQDLWRPIVRRVGATAQ